MAGEDREPFEGPEESLARELIGLRPYALRQVRAQAARPDPAFARSLRLRLVGAATPIPLFERLARVIATLVPPPHPAWPWLVPGELWALHNRSPTRRARCRLV